MKDSKMIHGSIVICVVLILCNLVNAQDVQFSMPYAATLNFNPAFAGAEGSPRVSGNYRNQWPNISGTNVYSALSYDQHVKQLKTGVGIKYYNEKREMGAFTKNRVSGIFAPNFRVFQNKLVIKPAIEATYAVNKYNWSKITFGSIPNANGSMKNSEVYTFFDLSSGVLLYSKIFHAGLAVHHINEPLTEVFYLEPLLRRYTGHIGANIGNVDSVLSFVVSPSVVFISQEDHRKVTLSCAFRYNVYEASVGYNDLDEIVLAAGFRSGPFRMAYCYDFSFSELGIATAGSHEISISFLFLQRWKPKDFLGFSTVSF